jgi:K+-transporting ATPase ATPase C chain
MKKNLLISVWFTLVTTAIFGVIYPLAVTALSQALFRDRANGEIIEQNGQPVGSRLIGQGFSGPEYFHSRLSSAGTGYDGRSSGGSNLGPTNKSLVDRVNGDIQRLHAENPSAVVPVDLITSSGSGLDPHISPDAAEFQIPRVARERHTSEAELRTMVARHTEGRQLGFLGESRVNVLELNLELDAGHPAPH